MAQRGRPRKIPLDGEIVDIGDNETIDVSLLPDAIEQAAIPDMAPEAGTPEFEAYVAALREKRKPYGAQMQKLALPQRAGYKRHWFNDVGGRVQEHLDAGWSHVLDHKGIPVKRTVGAARDNRALVAYAMEIPAVFWQEVEDQRHALAKAKMDDIKGSPARARPGEAKVSDQGKFYSPKEDAIQITESLSRS